MEDLPLRWSDNFAGRVLADYWSGGHANTSREAMIAIDEGVHIEFVRGSEYASAALVTRLPVIGDFDARVEFTVTQPAQGSTFELAAIGIDPPREPGLDQSKANSFTRSIVYDVHGAPPYVSSEYDEDDGWRIGWNRGPALAERDAANVLRSNNQYNRYGQSSAKLEACPVRGWLRLARTGTNWSTYRRVDDGLWVLTGEVRRMNLPDPVFLRLAAKHWVKARAGATQAPANKITFHLFELRSEQPQDLPAEAPAPPVEVALVRELRGCRKCPTFTSENLYGPFPQAEVGSGLTAVTVRGFAPPEPAALFGCRKAPVMLIGINPNLPGHFIFPRASDTRPSGSYRLSPFFASDADYAFHHRFGPERAPYVVDAAALDGLLRNDARSLLVADKAGELVAANGTVATGSFRLTARRAARLELKFDDGSCQVHNPTWSQGENLAIVRRRFAAGDVIAGRIDAGVIGRQVTVEPAEGLDSYHDNASTLLAGVSSRIPGSTLTIGEDMSLHDCVACASPRWDANEMPLEIIRHECVEERGWLHRQVVQSAPEVIVLAGRTALDLFASTGAGQLTPSLAELPNQAGGRDGLYQRVAKEGLWWTYRVGPVQRRVRVVVSAHLSYDDNFLKHAYFEAPDWQSFLATHQAAAQWLQQNNLVAKVYDSEDKMVLLGNGGDPHWAALRQVDLDAEAEIQQRWVDPYALLGQAVADALGERKVGLDANGHLRRSAGPCNFCDNALWRFDGGCRYDIFAG